MEKVWAGRFHGQLDAAADDFNSSIRFDARMAAEDIAGSAAHAAMLAAKGILSGEDAAAILGALADIREELGSATLKIDPACEDIHSFVEAELTRRIGEAGKRIHTARSRNDQVALDLRLHLKNECKAVDLSIRALVEVLLNKAQAHSDTIMPGYTHTQRAQPVTFGQHLMAYAMMLLRDHERLSQCVARMNVSPLGCCALAGTSYDTDREMTAKALCMDGVCQNSMDGVSDRDFCVELAGVLSILMMHLSRFAEEIILWCSWEFGFVTLSNAYSTGSSIMPQKKNPDIAELIRGKTGRVYGDLMGLLTMLKGLPLAYNKDMQEDKEAVFDAVDTARACLCMMAPLVETIKARPENMRRAAAAGFINATDCADYLVNKGIPFRTAYQITGERVARCIETGATLESLSLEDYRSASSLFEADIFEAISLEACVEKRRSQGGTAPEQVRAQIAWVRERTKEW